MAAAERPVADGCEAGIAAEPLADRRVPDEAEADRRHGRAEHATRGGMQRRGGKDDREDRHQASIGEGADGDERNRRPRQQCRSERAASTSAARASGRPGQRGPKRKTRPMSTCVHFWVVR